MDRPRLDEGSAPLKGEEPAFPGWARSDPEKLLLCLRPVNRNAHLMATSAIGDVGAIG
jgi:hypothetical protein